MMTNKKEFIGYVKVGKWTGVQVTELYPSMIPKRKSDIFTRGMYEFNRKKVKITVEELPDDS